MEKTSSIAYIFVVLSKWRRIFFAIFFIFAVLGVTISLLLPKWYRAESTIIPSSSYEGLSLTSALNPFQGGPFAFGASDELMKYLGILKSRTVSEAAIERFSLIELWGSRDMDAAVGTINKRVIIKLSDEGLIIVEAWEHNPQLTADLANFFVDQLQQVNTRLSVQSAYANRLFLEDRVDEMTVKLTEAEDKLRRFQEEKGAYAITDQTKAMIETAAGIQAQIYAIEVEIQVLEGSVKPDYPQLVNRRLELKELKKTMKTLQSDAASEDEANFQIPFDKIPEVGLVYLRLYREVEKHQKILEFLIPQFEQARFEEVKNTPAVQVLDRASPPLRKAKPVRSRLTLVIVFIGMLLTLMYVFIAERLRKMRSEDEEAYSQISSSMGAVVSDLKFWRRNKS